MKRIETPSQVRALLKQHSSFWIRQLELYPGDIAWLLKSGPLESGRSLRSFEAVWQKAGWEALGYNSTFAILRTAKRREMLRITVRDLANQASLEETVAELSALADFCLQRGLDAVFREMIAFHGKPHAEFGVFGLGKLGGQELNYSSDIDLIFVYSDEGTVGRLSHHDFFSRVAEKLVQGFRSTHEDASLFRVDLRLRPEGNAGPIVRSLESYETYYSAFGEVWERMALQKTRLVAGDPELGYEFIQHLQPFCFPKHLPPSALHEIYQIKCRIEAEILKDGGLERHVKLGRGGIREIEFAVQALQLLHGARNTFSQEQSTLKSLQALRRLDLLNAHDTAALTQAYIFLRRLEHRLQMQENQQTHTVPEDWAAQAALARGLGFRSHARFEAQWKEYREGVRAFFDRIVKPGSLSVRTTPEWDVATPERDQLLRKAGFQDIEKAAATLQTLTCGPEYAHVSQRTRGFFEQLSPYLLKTARELARPDLALQQLERFIEAYGSRASLYEFLASNPKILQLLLKLLDRSRFLTDTIVHQPTLLEAITFGGLLTTFHSAQEMKASLAQETAESVDTRLRLFSRAELLRIALRDILGLASSPEETFHELSQLADICLSEAVRATELSSSAPSKRGKAASKFAVIALGKYGGTELSYGSDLDILFVGDSMERAARTIAIMSQEQADGIVFKMDARLRPDGEDGPLILPLETYARYYSKRSQFWERQSLTRARFAAGDAALGSAFIELARQILYSRPISKSELKEMRTMRNRIEKERGNPLDPVRDFKTGAGGLVDVEFLTQAWQLLHGTRHPELRHPSTLKTMRALIQLELWKAVDGKSLIDDYLWLRKLEAILRCAHNRPVSQLPASRLEWELPAKYLGLKNAATLEKELKARRKRVHRLFERLLPR